jgi:hypothetical protein
MGGSRHHHPAQYHERLDLAGADPLVAAQSQIYLIKYSAEHRPKSTDD